MLRLRSEAFDALNVSQPNYATARHVIGQYLHVLQDFYSNTNWNKINPSSYYSDLGNVFYDSFFFSCKEREDEVILIFLSCIHFYQEFLGKLCIKCQVPVKIHVKIAGLYACRCMLNFFFGGGCSTETSIVTSFLFCMHN